MMDELRLVVEVVELLLEEEPVQMAFRFPWNHNISCVGTDSFQMQDC